MRFRGPQALTDTCGLTRLHGADAFAIGPYFIARYRRTGNRQDDGRARQHPSLMKQRTSKFAPLPQRQCLSIRGQRLNADMIRARSLMGLHPALDSFRIAPGNNRIDQMIAPAILDIFFRKTKP